MEAEECAHQWQRKEETAPNVETGMVDIYVVDTCAACGVVAKNLIDSRLAVPSELLGSVLKPNGEPVKAGPAPNLAAPAAPPAAPKPPEPQPAKGSVVVRAGREIAPLVPTTIQEAWLFCGRMAMSYTLPPSFYALPKVPEGVQLGEVNIIEVATARAFQALQLGMEVGLPPAQAIQSVLVLNGIGTIWGDAQLALVINSGLSEYVTETTEGGELWADKAGRIPNREFTWVCATKRVGKDAPEPTRFSVGDAIDAGLWGKKVWATHPGRLGKYKARAFCLRDNYPDVLKGLSHSREEMEGEIVDVTPSIVPANPAQKLTSMLGETMLQPAATSQPQVEPVDMPAFLLRQQGKEVENGSA